MAAFSFGVETSARVKAEGSLLNVTKEGKADAEVTALSMGNPALGHYDWGQTGFEFNVSGEKAGASIRIHGTGDEVYIGHMDAGNGDKDPEWEGGNNKLGPVAWLKDAGVWVKPIDMIKLNLGSVWFALDTEQIDWSQVTDFGGTGYGLEITPMSGLTFNVGLVDASWGWGSWIKDGIIGGTGLKAAYSADFGTVSALFSYTGKEDSKADLKFGLGYSGSAGSLSYWVDAFGFVDTAKDAAFTNLKAAAFVAYNAGSFGVKAYVPFGMAFAKDVDPVASLGAKLKLTYSFGGPEAYLVVKSDDFLAKSISVSVKPGITYSIGEASCECAVDMGFGKDKFTLAVPVSFSVSL